MKTTWKKQLEAVATARLHVQLATLGVPEDGDALIERLEALRAWQAATGVVRACAPLPVETPADHPTTGYDDIRQVAVARLGRGDLRWCRLRPSPQHQHADDR